MASIEQAGACGRHNARARARLCPAISRPLPAWREQNLRSLAPGASSPSYNQTTLGQNHRVRQRLGQVAASHHRPGALSEAGVWLCPPSLRVHAWTRAVEAAWAADTRANALLVRRTRSRVASSARERSRASKSVSVALPAQRVC